VHAAARKVHHGRQAWHRLKGRTLVHIVRIQAQLTCHAARVRLSAAVAHASESAAGHAPPVLAPAATTLPATDGTPTACTRASLVTLGDAPSVAFLFPAAAPAALLGDDPGGGARWNERPMIF
jgi:hypothetical protein